MRNLNKIRYLIGDINIFERNNCSNVFYDEQDTQERDKYTHVGVLKQYYFASG